jgi:glycerol-3-phosphate acyltransferase PlsX
MGGDFAPRNVVQGALDCARDPRCDFEILLVGQEDAIRAFLPESVPSNIRIRHADDVVDMKDSVATALKAKKNSSMYHALEWHRDGEVQGFISAGNTGAMMALSTLILGRLPGVERPSIGTFLPSRKGPVLLIDAGANVDSKPSHLAQFGIMGSIYTELMLKRPSPKVGLLNVGEEESKGNDASIAAWPLLNAAPIHFIGNIEGRDILKGTADVVVCDGFTGNIVLKFAESFPGLLKSKFHEYADQGVLKKLWVGLIAGTIKKMIKDWDYQEYGGVPLLGVNGVSIIGHGSSTPRAIMNMIFAAKNMVDRRVNETIREAMTSQKSTN